MQQKFFQQPFAFAGDKKSIEEGLQPSGVVSFNQGWGYDYQRDQTNDPNAKPIDRMEMNWLMGAITENIRQYQSYGFPEFITQADNGGDHFGYAKHAIVLWSANAMPPFDLYVSLEDNNTSDPTNTSKWVSFQTFAGGNAVKNFRAGEPLPTQNIGAIWHDDYNSIMTWQVFDQNGANYAGYASVLVGNTMMDAQPKPRKGYIASGVTNLSRTTYAALRNWAMHNGVMVATASWVAGTLFYADNTDGTTFRVCDMRGEFLRAWDNGRGIDAGRAFGTGQVDSFKSHYHVLSGTYLNGTSGTGLVPGGGVCGSWKDPTTNTTGAAETRPRNIAFLSAVKF